MRNDNRQGLPSWEASRWNSAKIRRASKLLPNYREWDSGGGGGGEMPVARRPAPFLVHLSSTFACSGVNNRGIYSSIQKQEVLEELIPVFPLIRHGPHRKRRVRQFRVAAGNCLPSRHLATVRGHTERPTDSPLIRRVQHFFYCCVCVRCSDNFFT
jgi:hypothetical protein